MHLRQIVLASSLLAGCFSTSPTMLSDAGGGDATPDWAYCAGFGTCSLEAAGCCDVCGAPTSADVHSVRAGADPVSAHRDDVCPMPPASCPACATTPNPALYPLCLASRCIVFDVRAQPLSTCSAHTDCVLVPHDCCTCTGGSVAVRADAVAAFRATICDPDSTCTGCSVPPTGIEAFCAPDGHCDVRPTP